MKFHLKILADTEKSCKKKILLFHKRDKSVIFYLIFSLTECVNTQNITFITISIIIKVLIKDIHEICTRFVIVFEVVNQSIRLKSLKLLEASLNQLFQLNLQNNTILSQKCTVA